MQAMHSAHSIDSASVRTEPYNEVSDFIPHNCITEFMEAERKKIK